MSHTDQETPVALVSGAGQGVGLGIARVLAKAGHRVALLDIEADRAIEAADSLVREGCVAIGLRLDVASAREWDQVVESVGQTWPRIDLLVNNAGISPRGTIESTDEALWDRTFAINLKGAWLGIKACLPKLRISRGAIVNIGSTRSTRPMPGLFAYVTSKAGLLGLTRQTAVECLVDGVRCNMVAPGWVDTPGERIIQANHGRPDFPEGLMNLVTPEEVGETVVFLTGNAGRRISGTCLYVDSGLHVADDAGMVYLPNVVKERYHSPVVPDQIDGSPIDRRSK